MDQGIAADRYKALTAGEKNNQSEELAEMPELPVRPPVLCAGCPHRASFYDVKCAMKGKKTIFCGDIGCYTLGNAMPLDMVDTCLCMGAGLGIAQGATLADTIYNFFICKTNLTGCTPIDRHFFLICQTCLE